MKIFLLLALCGICYGKSIETEVVALDPAADADDLEMPDAKTEQEPNSDVEEKVEEMMKSWQDEDEDAIPSMEDPIEKRSICENKGWGCSIKKPLCEFAKWVRNRCPSTCGVCPIVPKGKLLDVVCHWQLGQATATSRKDFMKLGYVYGKNKDTLKICASECKKRGANGAMVNLRNGRHCTCVKNMNGRNFKLENVVVGEIDNPPRYASCKFGVVVKPDYKCDFKPGQGHSKEILGLAGTTEMRLDMNGVASRDLCVQLCQERKLHWVRLNAVTVTPSEGHCWCEISMTTFTPSDKSKYCYLS